MSAFLQDLRATLRMMIRNPTIYAAAILALTLGIGANTLAFSVANAVLLRPLPFPDAHRLVVPAEHFPRLDDAVLGPDYLVWRDENHVFQDIAAIDDDCKATVTGGADPWRLACSKVSANFSSVLGVQPVFGRFFVASDDQPGAPDTAVLGYGVWQQQFGGDRSIVGRSVTINRKPHVVVGVMPAGFRYRRAVELWLPLRLNAAEQAKRDQMVVLNTVARLAPGVSVQQAAQEIDRLTQRLVRAFPAMYSDGVRTSVATVQERLVRNFRSALLMLIAAVGALHLIACVNIANLMVARALQRKSEMAVRLALGGTRARVVRLHVIESAVIALTGTVFGVLFTLWSLDALVGLSPLRLTSFSQITLDWRVLAFAAGVAVTTVVLTALVPMLTARLNNLSTVLREGSRTVVGAYAYARLRHGLLIAEVALTVVLVAAAGTTVRSLLALRAVDVGFNVDNLLLATLAMDRTAYKTEPQRIAFVEDALGRIEQLPGVRGAAVYQSTAFGPLTVENRPVDPGERPLSVLYYAATPNLFQTMGIALREGRLLSPTDTADAQKVVVINDVLAKRTWGTESPLGRRIKFGPADSPYPWATVVGVIASVRQSPVEPNPRMAMYMPYRQLPAGSVAVVVRTTDQPLKLAEAVKAQIRSVNKDQAFDDITSWEARMANFSAPLRFNTMLLVLFAALALCHTAVGIYGLVACAVAQRSGEIAVRLAMGAAPGQAIRLVTSRYVVLATIGAAVGSAVALALGQVLPSIFATVVVVTPWICGLLAVFVIGIATLASYSGARPAARVDPVTALRSQ